MVTPRLERKLSAIIINKMFVAEIVFIYLGNQIYTELNLLEKFICVCVISCMLLYSYDKFLQDHIWKNIYSKGWLYN